HRRTAVRPWTGLVARWQDAGRACREGRRVPGLGNVSHADRRQLRHRGATPTDEGWLARRVIGDDMGAVAPSDGASQEDRRDRQADARALAATRRQLFIVGTVVSLGVEWLAWASGLSAALWSGLGALPQWISIFVYVAIVLLVLTLVASPLGYYRGHVLSRRY